VRYREILPPPLLRPLVRCLWLLEDWRGHGEVERVLPDVCIEVVVHYGSPMVRCLADGRRETQPGAVVAGQLRTAMQLASTGPVGMVAARFEPWAAAPFLRESAHALTSQVVPLDALWGADAHALEERIRAAPGDATRLGLLAGALTARLLPPDETGRALRQAVTWIAETRGAIPVGEIARRLQWSRRRLERRFVSAVGLSAKSLCRIERFQYVLAALRPDGPPTPDATAGAAPGTALDAATAPGRPVRLVDLAMDAGYADQAHLSREFKELAGLPVTQYLAEQHALSDFLVAGGGAQPDR
jgi:AraC-like DNA-binding protein